MNEQMMLIAILAIGSVVLIRFVRSLAMVAVVGLGAVAFLASGTGAALFGDSLQMATALVQQVQELLAYFSGFIGDYAQA